MEIIGNDAFFPPFSLTSFPSSPEIRVSLMLVFSRAPEFSPFPHFHTFEEAPPQQF